MRLLLVVPSFYPEAYGGAERQAAILAEALVRRGVQVSLLAPTLGRDLPEEGEASFGRILRVRVRDFPARGGKYIASTLAWTWKVARLIRARRAAFDLVYVFHGRLHVAGPLIGGKLAGLPVFVKPGGGGANSDYRALKRKKGFYGHLVAALKTRWTAGFIAVSQEIVEDLRQAGVEEGRIHLLPNGVELPPPGEIAAARAQRTGRRFISTARLVHDKNVDVLVRAAAATPGVELTVVGDGPEQTRLEALAGELGAGERVRFLGAVDDVGPELIGHDAFLTASVREGLSNALLEALAHAVPPIAANASGVADVVADGRTGIVASGATPEAFAAAMRRLLDLPETARAAMSEQAYREAAARFAIDEVAGRLLTLFGAALAQGR